ERRPHVLAGVRGLLLRVHQVEVVARIPFVQGRDPDFVAAVVAQDALLRARRQCGIGEGDVEPAGAVGRVGAGRVVGREGDHGAHERRRTTLPAYDPPGAYSPDRTGRVV